MRRSCVQKVTQERIGFHVETEEDRRVGVGHEWCLRNHGPREHQQGGMLTARKLLVI